jgi:HNH endonuclease
MDEMEITRYPEGFTGADLRRQLGIKETPAQKHARRKHTKARRKELGMICVREQFKVLKKFRKRWKLAHGLPYKIELLKEMAQMKFNNPRPPEQRRAAFEKRKKFMRIWYRDCKVCGNPSVHRHHIIQVQNGGMNEEVNIMPLCENCHASIHTWMEVKVPDVMAETMARVEREL